jgi:hypothetical protein
MCRCSTDTLSVEPAGGFEYGISPFGDSQSAIAVTSIIGKFNFW